MSQLPLQGIRVLDFSRVLAGPLCAMTLADLGADVIKVENPDGGDETRQWGPPWLDSQPPMSAYFISVNRNKRSLTLNLKSSRAQEIARALARQSHIVLENLRPGQMARFGLDFESLTLANPALVYCSITGFGHDSLYHDRPGYDYVIQAMTGLMSITGPTDGEASKVGVAVSDVFTALYACNAIQAALRQAEKIGTGQHIDMALFDSQLAALVNVASNYLVSGKTPQRFGNQHANIVPYQTFDAEDGSFVVAVGNDGQFSRLCSLIERPDLALDERFSTNPARVTHRDELISILQTIFHTRPVESWVDVLLATGIPAGPINTVADALDDANTHSRNLIQQVHTSDGSPVQLLGSPMRFSGHVPEIRLPPPHLGEHTHEILAELLGYSTQDIDTLRQQGVT